MTTEEQFNVTEKSKRIYTEDSVMEQTTRTYGQNEITDEQLDNAIDSVLASPEVNAMLENAAADAADDAKLAQGKPFDPTGTFSGSTQAIIKAPSIGDRPVTYKDFKAFEERVAAAFKHAGFKF